MVRSNNGQTGRKMVDDISFELLSTDGFWCEGLLCDFWLVSLVWYFSHLVFHVASFQSVFGLSF